MQYDSDVVLIGTGVAPLIAANQLLIAGKSVLLLNPDWDFFLEESELPFDPLLQGLLNPPRLLRSSPEEAISILRPNFPGPIEFWSINTEQTGFHDPTAPHIRQRERLWITSGEPGEKDSPRGWEILEDLFVEASDADLNPQILKGPSAVRRFPGYSSYSEAFQGLLIPKLCDVDSVRYRNGLMEFVRERLGSEKVIRAVTDMDWIPEGIRFRAGGAVHSARLNLGALVFWTPRLTNWILNQSRKFNVTPPLPKGVRLWEQWSLISRQPPSPYVIGMFSDMAVWADFEGPPSGEKEPPRRLSVLRAGPLLAPDARNLPETGLSWASGDSLNSLSRLCHGFFKWDYATIRSMKARAIFEWNGDESWLLSSHQPSIRVVTACDGPLIDIVRVTQAACSKTLVENG